MKDNRIVKNTILILLCFVYVFLLVCYVPEFHKFVFKNVLTYFKLESVEEHILISTHAYNILISFFAGVAICISGAIFQSVFKNPLASPRTIGTSAGVTLGNMLFVLTYGGSAAYFIGKRYLYCYGISIFIVVLVGLFAKILNRSIEKFSVEAFLMTGILVSNFIDVFVIYCQNLLINDDSGLIYIYMQYANGDIIFLDKLSLIVFFSVFMLCICGSLVIRRKVDALTFSDDEAYAMGVNVRMQRLFSITIGTALSTVAVVHCGGMGFVAMAIPYFFRMTSKRGFYDVCLKSAVAGGLFIATAREVFSILLVEGIGLPSSSVVTLVTLPLFMILVLKNKVLGHDENHNIYSFS